MTGIDRATAANLLRRLRESRGWSWADLARAMRDVARQRDGSSSRTHQVASIQRTIARWESGSGRTRPGDHYQVLLAQIYARTPDGALALGRGSDFANLLDALYHFGIPESRCGQLADLVVRVSKPDFGAEPTRDDGVAMSLYRDATRSAGRLSDRRHCAGVRTSQTMVIMHATGDLRVAGQTARAAVADAHDSASYGARARAHAVHAEVCARAGLDRQARTALERAWTTIDQLQLDDAPSGFNADRLRGFDGLCRLHLGNANDANDRLAVRSQRWTSHETRCNAASS